MAREVIDPPAKEKTSIFVSKELLDRVSVQARKNSESISDFMSRAFVNQLEREGDIEIRSIMIEESGGSMEWLQ